MALGQSHEPSTADGGSGRVARRRVRLSRNNLVDPRGVEAPRHAARQHHARARLAQVARVDHQQLGAALDLIVNQGQEPAVILGAGGGAGARREHRLAAEPIGAVDQGLVAAAIEVVADHAVEQRHALAAAREPRRVAEARPPPRVAVVDARELRRRIVEGALAHAPAREIESPLVQAGASGIRPRLGDAIRVPGVVGRMTGRREHVGLLHPARLEHHLVAFLVGVEHVKDVARRSLEPAHRAVVAMARHDAEARGRVAVEEERCLALHQPHRIEDQRQVHEDGVARRDREVVHHDAARDLDRYRAHQIARRRHHAVQEEVRPHRVVAEEHHLAGDRVDLGMSGERRWSLPP